MGDYVKLVVNCSIAKIPDEQLDSFTQEIKDNGQGLLSSAHHCGGEVCHVSNEWHHRTDVTYVCQFKYGNGLEEFLSWLEPKVVDGMGPGGAWALVFTEYAKEPDIRYTQSKDS